MQCPSCGANVNGAFCEFCGAKMPVERVETQSIHGENVVVNNYYHPELQQPVGPEPVVFNVQVACVSPKSRTVALLLCIFLGFFGAHRFYAGRYLMGIIYLLTLGLFGIGWLVDLILIAVGKMHDSNGLAITNW